MKTQRTPFGTVSQISSCLNCEGSGKVITEHCAECYGSGRVPVERIIKVDIPGGIDDGSTIRITGGGAQVVTCIYLSALMKNKASTEMVSICTQMFQLIILMRF